MFDESEWQPADHLGKRLDALDVTELSLRAVLARQ
jgi:hypothetical protein